MVLDAAPDVREQLRGRNPGLDRRDPQDGSVIVGHNQLLTRLLHVSEVLEHLSFQRTFGDCRHTVTMTMVVIIVKIPGSRGESPIGAAGEDCDGSETTNSEPSAPRSRPAETRPAARESQWPAAVSSSERYLRVGTRGVIGAPRPTHGGERRAEILG